MLQGEWQYLLARRAGRFVTRLAAVLTLGQMPPFVSASAVVVDRDRLLVVIDPIRHEPVLPGGHLKWAESPISAVVREVKEETGYQVQPRELLGVYSGAEWCGEPGTVRVVYVADLTGGEIQSSSEGQAAWIPLYEAVSSPSRDAAIIRQWMERAVG